MDDARDEQGEYKSFEEEIYWRHIRRISFYSTFHSDSKHMLQIPKKFADIIRSNLLHPKMTLKGPSGVSWEVDLIREGDDLFLQQGWQEFANAYSLQENDTLIFKYDRNSTLRVKIFSGEFEKIAAYFVRKCGHVYPADESQEKRVLSENEDVEYGVGDAEVCTAAKKSRKTELVNHVGKVRRCVTLSKKVVSSRKRVQSAITLVRKKAASSSMMAKQAEAESDRQHGQNSLSNDEVPIESVFPLPTNRAETEPYKEREQNILNNEEVPHQSGFQNIALPAKTAEIGPAKQHKRNFLTNNEVPQQSGFESILLPATRGEIELAKQPDVSIKKEPFSPDMQSVASPGTRGRRTTSLSRPSDIECISNRRPVTDEEKTSAMRKAASELSENSFFVALPISSCYKYFNLTIPTMFATTHLGVRNREVYLCMGKKKWITKFSFSTGGLCTGWKKFALNNNLEESDVCLFKLLNETTGEGGEPVMPVMLDVTIFRVVDEVTPPTLYIGE